MLEHQLSYIFENVV